ncbi:Uncharacterised protein [Acinetobacter baumannii]|nr:Uncharacterised protein [Acinetobacter baumannii]
MKLLCLLLAVIRTLSICMTLKMQKTRSIWVLNVNQWFYVKKSVAQLLTMKLDMQLLLRFYRVLTLCIR